MLVLGRSRIVLVPFVKRNADVRIEEWAHITDRV